MNQHIFTFDPVYKTTLWGGDKIAPYKNEHIPQANIGESWEISAVPGNESVESAGADKGMMLSELCHKYGKDLLGSKCIARYGHTFPLLVKIIDARKDLSVQVHPDDALARKRHNCFGKTEMWYVVDTDDDATISCGFSRELNPRALGDVVSHGRFREFLANHKSSPGDCFFIPAGRVHSIGGGNLLVEIQQSSDVTYRIDDFNRRDADGNLRELHLDLARDSIDYSVKDDYMTHYRKIIGHPDKMVDCSHFKTDILFLEPGHDICLNHIESFRVIVCIDGEITIDAADHTPTVIGRGHSALIAAEVDNIRITAGSRYSTLLLCNV